MEVDGGIIIEKILKKWLGGHRLRRLTEGRDIWQASVNTLRTFAFYQMWGIWLLIRTILYGISQLVT
jgi:hypothetical protein